MMAVTPRWGFRVASRPEAGAGHLSRCLALADALGGNVAMFLDPTGPDPAFATRLTRTQRREAAPERCDELLAALRNDDVQAAVMDSYALDGATIREIAGQAFTVSIDDEHGIVNSHLSIRPSLVPAPSAAGVNGGRILSGGQYALLDKAFAAVPISPPPLAGQRPRLLVSFGARDSKNVTGLVLGALESEFAKMERITVVLGEAAPHRADLLARYAGYSPVAFAAPPSAQAMRALCDDHDFYLGAGGVGLLERMASGLPGIVMSVAANQDANESAAVNAGAAISGGLLRDFDPAALRTLLVRSLSDGASLARTGAHARDLVDGRGCERAASAMQAAYQAWRGQHVSL
jgi:spore coat polysaccharide biosynthesis predicted glycosyltransferase SpsG